MVCACVCVPVQMLVSYFQCVKVPFRVRVCVCMCEGMQKCLHVCDGVCAYHGVCASASMYVYGVCACAYVVHVCMYVYTCRQVCARVCVRACSCVHSGAEIVLKLKKACVCAGLRA